MLWGFFVNVVGFLLLMLWGFFVNVVGFLNVH